MPSESGFAAFFQEADDVARGDAFAPFMMKKAIAQPVIDGRLDDICWSIAEGRAFVAAMGGGSPATGAATEAKAVWTESGVTFGVRCDDPDAAKIDVSKPTGIPVSSDNMELFIDCSGENGGAFRQLIIATATEGRRRSRTRLSGTRRRSRSRLSPEMDSGASKSTCRIRV